MGCPVSFSTPSESHGHEVALELVNVPFLQGDPIREGRRATPGLWRFKPMFTFELFSAQRGPDVYGNLVHRTWHVNMLPPPTASALPVARNERHYRIPLPPSHSAFSTTRKSSVRELYSQAFKVYRRLRWRFRLPLKNHQSGRIIRIPSMSRSSQS